MIINKGDVLIYSKGKPDELIVKVLSVLTNHVPTKVEFEVEVIKGHANLVNGSKAVIGEIFWIDYLWYWNKVPEGHIMEILYGDSKI